ncbi:hypothetical protein SAMN02910384_03249 [Pseudobutyrivibrio sp. ACV-2]|nr:hypothetical protein SAMN02910384_03249 [Pseudobutyrivibrio sp. ACV-2]
MRINSNYIANVRQSSNSSNPVNKKIQSSFLNDSKNIRNNTNCQVFLSHESEAYTDYVNKMDSILDKLGNAEEISQNEKQWLNSEIESIISGQYGAFSSFSFKRQDILNNLVEDKKHEDKRMNDLLEQLKKDKQAISPNNSIDLETELSLKNEAKLIEKFTEAMEDEEDLTKEHICDELIPTDEFFTDRFRETYIDKELKKAKDDLSQEMIHKIKEYQAKYE